MIEADQGTGAGPDGRIPRLEAIDKDQTFLQVLGKWHRVAVALALADVAEHHSSAKLLGEGQGETAAAKQSVRRYDRARVEAPAHG